MFLKTTLAILVSQYCVGGLVVPIHAQEIPARQLRVSAPQNNPFESQIFELVNRQRQKMSFSRLDWNADLAAVARQYSYRMAREGFFDHYDPQGLTALDRASSVRGWAFIGENLFMCESVPGLPSFALRGWLESETHRSNLLDPTWTATGVGVAQADSGDIFVTQLFTKR